MQTISIFADFKICDFIVTAVTNVAITKVVNSSHVPKAVNNSLVAKLLLVHF